VIVPIVFLLAAGTSNPPSDMNSRLAPLLFPAGIAAWIGCIRLGTRLLEREKPTLPIAFGALGFILAELFLSAILSMLIFGSGID
jgi:hypothetical protein